MLLYVVAFLVIRIFEPYTWMQTYRTSSKVGWHLAVTLNLHFLHVLSFLPKMIGSVV